MSMNRVLEFPLRGMENHLFVINGGHKWFFMSNTYQPPLFNY